MARDFTIDDLKNFEEVIRKRVPGFRVAFKDASFVQRLLGFVMRPFNHRYMTDFTSTFYPVVWFPTQERYESNPRNSFVVLAHEYVHLVDTSKRPIWFRVSYVMPQALGVIPFIVYQALIGVNPWVMGTLVGGILVGLLVARTSVLMSWIMIAIAVLGTLLFAFFSTGWAALILLLGFGLLAPWSSPWRTNWELRGYAVQVSLAAWVNPDVPAEDREKVIKHFTAGDYYFMSWNAAHIRRCIDDIVTAANNRSVLAETPYDDIYAFAVSTGVVEPKG